MPRKPSFDTMFREAHEKGAREFGSLWLHIHGTLSSRLGEKMNVSDPKIKAAVAVAVLCALQSQKGAEKRAAAK